MTQSKESLITLCDDILELSDMQWGSHLPRELAEWAKEILTPQGQSGAGVGMTEEEFIRVDNIRFSNNQCVQPSASIAFLCGVVSRLSSAPAVGAGWPGTVPACPACMSMSDVEWAVCVVHADVCPLKKASPPPAPASGGV